MMIRSEKRPQRFLGFVIATAFLFLLGCSSFSLKEPNIKRTPELKNVWSTIAPISDRLRARFLEPMKPLVHEDLVFFGNSVDSIAAYHRKSGRLVWKRKVKNGASGGAAIYKNSLLFGGHDGQFYRVQLRTGDPIWTFPTRSETLSEPLVVDERVYFLSGSNTLFCLDAETGEKIWIHSRRATSAFSIRGGSRPVLKAGKLFVGFADGSIVAFEADKGKVLWEQNLNRNKKFKDVDSTAVISGFELFISGFDDALYSLDWSTGQVNWRFESGGYGEVLLTENRVFMSSSSGKLFSLDRQTGKQIWEKPVSGVATQPLLYKGYLFFGESDGNLRMVTLDGKPVTHFQPGRGVFTPLAITEDDFVYFGSNQSNLYALKIKFDPGIGKWHWEK